MKEGFATAGHTLPRTARPANSEESLAAAKTIATDLLSKFASDGSEGFDVVLECTGVETCMQAAISVRYLLPLLEGLD